MLEKDTLCFKLREINKIVENNFVDKPEILVEIKKLLNEATYKATKMDIKLWEYKLKESSNKESQSNDQ